MSISNFFLLALGLTFVSYLLAFFIAHVTFRPSLNTKLVGMFDGIVFINHGSLIFLSLSLAFIFSDVAQVNVKARAAVISEADALRTLGRISLSLDRRVGEPLMATLKQYTQDVLQKEWPEMRRSAGADLSISESSALAPLTKLSDIVFNPHNQSLLTPALTGQLISYTNRIREQRLLRIEFSRYSIGYPRLGLILFLLSASVILLTLSAVSKRPVQIVSNFTLLLLTLISLLVVHTQQNPFAALDAVSPLPIEEALRRLELMKKVVF
jgi:hypothetical protein